LKVYYTVQATGKTKRLSKQQAANLGNKQHDDEIQRSIQRSNLIRQQQFKKIKKNQKKAGKIIALLYFCVEFYLIRKIYGQLG
jgi:plasmid replication initiation protein